MLPVKTFRDLTIFQKNEEYIVIACDSLGSIGEKEHDEFKIDTKISGKYTLRVCLNELFAVNASPVCIVSLVSNEWNPTGQRVLEGIRNELEFIGMKDLPVNGSTEENFATSMTAFGMTVIASTDNLKFRNTKPGYNLYLYGMPYVGPEVIANSDKLLNPLIIKDIMEKYTVGDFLPCGSGGISKEVLVIEKENNLQIELFCDGIDTNKSAGPATCGIFTAAEDINYENVIKIGRVKI